MQSREDKIREGLNELTALLRAAGDKSDDLFLAAIGNRGPSTNVVVVSIDGEVRVYAPNSHNVEVIFIDGDDRDPRIAADLDCRQLEDETHPIYKGYVRVY